MNENLPEPFVSVIIPVYNQGKTIRDCVSAIKKSNYANYEIIVLNCGSTDNSEEILKELPIKAITYCIKTPPGKTRNDGASYSNGEILIFADADVLIGENTIRHTVEIIDANSEIAGVSLFYSREHPNKNLFSQYQNLFINYRFTRMEQYSITPTTSYIAIKRGIFFDVGGFDEKMKTYEDFEFGYRVFLKKNMKFIIDKTEQIIHCKYFNFAILLKDYFTKTRNMISFRLNRTEYFKFSTASKTAVPFTLILSWLLSVPFVISGIMYMIGVISSKIFLFFFILYLLTVFPFCNYLRKSNGFLFFLKSILLTIAVGVVIDYAVIWAVVKFFGGRLFRGKF